MQILRQYYTCAPKLGYILGVNILGLIVQLPSLPKLIENLLRLDIFFEYAKASTYLDWGLYIIGRSPVHILYRHYNSRIFSPPENEDDSESAGAALNVVSILFKL